MTDILKPRDEQDVSEAVARALAEEKTLEVVGHGSKRAIGRAAQTDMTLDVSKLSGIEIYEPEELILSAKAGTPVAEIEKALAKNEQELAFEPMNCAPLLGGKPGRGTLGGMMAVNLSGPRRIKAGAMRDFALGFQAISGRGEPFKAGGRVVKNVTGYDLPKFVAGSWGTLAVVTQATIKVLPRSEAVETVVVLGLDDTRAVEAMSVAMGSSCEVSGAAHLPLEIARNLSVIQIAACGRSVTALRLEGIPVSIAYRKEKLQKLLAPFGDFGKLGSRDSRNFWRGIRDAMPFADGTQNPVWRVSTSPSEAPRVAAAIRGSAKAEIFFDWAGGLLWVRMPGKAAEEWSVRSALAGRGHALLVRADPAVRASAQVFEPLEPGMAAISKRLKESFDPRGILNPGRMYAGI